MNSQRRIAPQCYKRPVGQHVYPITMSDGRFVTRYRSTNELTNDLQQLNNIPSNNRFREFLQSNALKIMKAEREEYERNYNIPVACSQGFYDFHRNGQNWTN